jgi:hypothetical protein
MICGKLNQPIKTLQTVRAIIDLRGPIRDELEP